MRARVKDVFLTGNWLEAQLVASLLEGSGLNPFVLGGAAGSIGIPGREEYGSIKVAVPSNQLEDALAILREYRGKEGLDPNYGSPWPPRT